MYCPAVSLAPCSNKKTDFLHYSTAERQMTIKNTLLFLWFESWCMWSNADANHLELFKLLFFTFSCYFLFIISATFLREQISCLSEWMGFDLKQSGHKTERFLVSLFTSKGWRWNWGCVRKAFTPAASWASSIPSVKGGEGRNGAQGTFTALCSAGFGMLGWLEFAHIPDLSGKRRLSCTQLQSYALCTPKQIRGFVFSLDFSLAAGKKNISKDSKRKLQAGNSVSPKCSKQGKLDLGKDAKWEQMW